MPLIVLADLFPHLEERLRRLTAMEIEAMEETKPAMKTILIHRTCQTCRKVYSFTAVVDKFTLDQSDTWKCRGCGQVYYCRKLKVRHTFFGETPAKEFKIGHLTMCAPHDDDTICKYLGKENPA